MDFILNQRTASEYRHELKYVFPGMEESVLTRRIKSHAALFSEIFHARWVNNIYFDHPDLTTYYSSVNGVVPRVKIRLRWYEEFFGPMKPTLEFKLKKANKNVKVSFSLDSMEITPGMTLYQLKKDLLNNPSLPKEIKNTMKQLRPTLANRYLRRYYQSEDKTFRMTLDSCLDFSSLLRRCEIRDLKSGFQPLIIAELKFNEDDSKVSHIVHDFAAHFRLIRMSKYTTGLEWC